MTEIVTGVVAFLILFVPIVIWSRARARFDKRTEEQKDQDFWDRQW